MLSKLRSGAIMRLRTSAAALLVLPLLLSCSNAAPRDAEATSAASGPAGNGKVPPTILGVELTGLFYYSTERSFNNLVALGQWSTTGANGGPVDMPPGAIMPDGEIDWTRVSSASTMLGPNGHRPVARRIVCTWTGSGGLSVHGAVDKMEGGPRRLSFEWKAGGGNEAAWVAIGGVDPKRPFRNLDCREPDRPRDQLFDPGFLASLKPFSVARFMDWQWTNANDPADWATRRRPSAPVQSVNGGVAVEHMMALVRQAQVDPWFNMPYRADAAYVRGFAQLVHDQLPPDRTVYVEHGNEVWNTAFDATRQAQKEGAAAGLSGDATDAGLLRYVQRSIETFRIWSEVFADRPGKLVRVLATQHYRPASVATVMAVPGVRENVDALATAPYFYVEGSALARRADGTPDLDGIFRQLDGAVDTALDLAVQHKAVAARYGKRYLAYEAGQHMVLPGNGELLKRIERDPRMGTLYTRYLEGWRKRVGDTIILFASTSGIAESGAWGLREYSGQPLDEAPKARAVEAFAATLSR